MEGSSIDPDWVGNCGPLSSTLGFTARDRRGPNPPPLFFLQRFALLPRNYVLTPFCMGLSHHSPPHQDLFFFLIFYAAPSQTLGQQGRSQDEEREVNPTPDQTRAWRGVLPTLSLPKKNTVIFQKGAKPSMDKAEADGWGGGGGGRHMAKGILRKHTGRVAA